VGREGEGWLEVRGRRQARDLGVGAHEREGEGRLEVRR
jgi:hypothetical protein